MHSFTLAEVAGILRLPEETLRGLVKSGYAKPQRGAGRRLRFTFQDVVVLKTAHRLLSDAVPRRKITKAIRALREQLPDLMPLAGLRVSADGEDVVVQDKAGTWEPISGQGLLSFELVRHENALRLFEPRGAAVGELPLDDWFDAAVDLEESDPIAAARRYRQIIEADASYIDAYINCGRLLHEAEDLAAAETLYRDAMNACDACATLNYNLAVVLEDAGRVEEAITAYQHALQCDPDHGDSHFNLARLYELTQRSQHAIRHYNRYRRLTRRAD